MIGVPIGIADGEASSASSMSTELVTRSEMSAAELALRHHLTRS
jgi:hypothetical protein